MNKLIIRSLVLTVLLLTSVSAWSQGTQVVDILLSRPGEPVTLDIDILSARIEVVGEEAMHKSTSRLTPGNARSSRRPARSK